MTDKKSEAPEAKAPAPREAPESPASMAARLLASYLHNMEHAAPRTLEELQIIQTLAAPPESGKKAA